VKVPGRKPWNVVALIAVLALVLAAVHWRAQVQTGRRLVLTEPVLVMDDSQLVAYANALAAPLYTKHCASCHGANLRGSQARGVPNLVDDTWIYSNTLVDLERTITYGIRSGHPMARNVAEMPAEGRTAQLTRAEIADVAEFVLSISGQQFDSIAAARGHDIFYAVGNCFDCHANDAHGNLDYGTPSLVGHDWIYGGDRQTLIYSITNGRHGICPAWVNTLDPVELRAMAVYLLSRASTRS
jgi:cytochrome c oxidase cbb3-type subunit 3